MATERVVIVGAGHAGFQLGASLRQGGFDGAIVLLSDEPVLPYQRPPLSKDYLDGKIGLDLLLMRPEKFYRDHRIDYLAGTRAAEIDRAAKCLRLASGERFDYDHLVLATGARNRVPPMPGIELDGVCYLRTLAETDQLRDRLAAAEHVLVIGAGFIGLEFAAVARSHGKPVRILELTDRVMGRVVCPPTSEFFAAAHRRTRVEFGLGAQAVQNAADHARCVADRILGKPHPYTALPWFWSEQGPLRLQIAGLTAGHDHTVLRGAIEQGEFSVFCYRDGSLLGVESINRPADHAHARRLLAAGRQVSTEQAADDGFDLRAAAAARTI